MHFCRSLIKQKSVTVLGYHCYPRYLSSSSSGKQNYYDVLGIDKNSTRKEIRKAFLDKSKEYHPDSVARSHLSSTQLKNKFQEINEAYQVLNDPTERQVYDESIKYPKAGYSQSKWGHSGYGNYSDYQQYRAHQEFMRNQGHYWANYNRATAQDFEDLTWRSFFRWKMGQPISVANFLVMIFVLGVFVEILHTVYIFRYFNSVKKERERVMYGSNWFQSSQFDETQADRDFNRFILTSELKKSKNEKSSTTPL